MRNYTPITHNRASDLNSGLGVPRRILPPFYDQRVCEQ